MSSKKKTLILLAAAAILFALPAFAGKIGLKIYLDNKPVPVKAIEQDGEIYVSISDLAKVFPSNLNLDTSSARLDITTSPSGNVPGPSVGKPALDKGISGSICLKEGTGKEFFLKRMKVGIYSFTKEIPEDVSIGQLRKMASGSAGDYLSTHGLVRETASDESGNFYFESLAPGKYELICIYTVPGGKKGYFWRNVINVEKDKPISIELNSENVYKF
ncbi:MAG: carboxypeptidase-like regulatory domain-containing protein [Firmicutes bacterium]|nr:carboxypeptidase-like regulatory domain-containing protein [Bacillota bacterium]